MADESFEEYVSRLCQEFYEREMDTYTEELFGDMDNCQPRGLSFFITANTDTSAEPLTREKLEEVYLRSQFTSKDWNGNPWPDSREQ